MEENDKSQDIGKNSYKTFRVKRHVAIIANRHYFYYYYYFRIRG